MLHVVTCRLWDILLFVGRTAGLLSYFASGIAGHCFALPGASKSRWKAPAGAARHVPVWYFALRLWTQTTVRVWSKVRFSVWFLCGRIDGTVAQRSLHRGAAFGQASVYRGSV